jgi:hypothetical protein
LIRPDDHVDDLLDQYPALNTYLMRKSIMCVQCGEVFWGTIAELIQSKGLDVDSILAEINEDFGNRD